MSESEDTVDWTQLREFAAVDLSKSFVLSWSREDESFVIEVDLYLTPEHPFYEEPRPAEKVCIRPARIEFPYCDTVHHDRADDIDEFGHGAIESFNASDGVYEISGEFGTVVIDAERPLLRLKTP